MNESDNENDKSELLDYLIKNAQPNDSDVNDY